MTATFSEAVDVDTTGGNPRLKIKMAPTYGEKWAGYSGGSGTTTLTFDYTVVKPNTSTGGYRGACEHAAAKRRWYSVNRDECRRVPGPRRAEP